MYRNSILYILHTIGVGDPPSEPVQGDVSDYTPQQSSKPLTNKEREAIRRENLTFSDGVWISQEGEFEKIDYWFKEKSRLKSATLSVKSNSCEEGNEPKMLIGDRLFEEDYCISGNQLTSRATFPVGLAENGTFTEYFWTESSESEREFYGIGQSKSNCATYRQLSEEGKPARLPISWADIQAGVQITTTVTHTYEAATNDNREPVTINTIYAGVSGTRAYCEFSNEYTIWTQEPPVCEPGSVESRGIRIRKKVKDLVRKRPTVDPAATAIESLS
ncbi:hypothetical protein B0O99DRAFT_670843 [Bisporella sp. PMI_857]|nr:hypothetical protein B0O99DRAFT_670843 [Bisporella sp. PMI_857]